MWSRPPPSPLAQTCIGDAGVRSAIADGAVARTQHIVRSFLAQQIEPHSKQDRKQHKLVRARRCSSVGTNVWCSLRGQYACCKLKLRVPNHVVQAM
eukprot:1631711-Pyramimonas_sp.AAC.1